MTDAEIVEAFFSRNETAIEEAKLTYGSYCASIARNILCSWEDVEEILNDTWLHAWNAIPPARPENLKLYLARITRNLAFDRFRLHRSEKRGGGEIMLALDELSDCIGTENSPENVLEADELKLSVNRFLSTLPFRDREVFLLRYFYIASTEEIANRLGIRPDLVRTRLSRTRKKLKAHLLKEGFIHG